MRERDELPVIIIERHAGGLEPFFWGALLGAGVALLLAPRTGAETQAEIRTGARRLRGAAEERVAQARASVFGAVDRTRGSVQERLDSVRDVVQTRTSQAKQALEAGRQAAYDARSELQQRLDRAKRSAYAGRSAGEPASIVFADEVVITEVVDAEPTGRGELD